MLSRSHIALALLQFAGALAVAILLLGALGLGTRTVLIANLSVCLLAIGLTGAAALAGKVRLNRRLARSWPTYGLLLVPVAFTGWAAEQSEPMRSAPDLLAVVQCALPFTVLLALQNAVVVPHLAPTASESPISARSCARLFTYFALALTFLLLWVGVASRFLVEPFAPATHLQLEVLIPLFALAYALNAVHCALAPALNLSERPALLSALGAGAAGMNLALNLALVPAFGFVGASVSTVATFLALAAATLWAAQRRFPLAFEYGRLSKIACSAAIVYLAAIRWPMTHEWPILVGYALMITIAFPIVLALSGFLRAPERAALRRMGGSFEF